MNTHFILVTTFVDPFSDSPKRAKMAPSLRLCSRPGILAKDAARSLESAFAGSFFLGFHASVVYVKG